MINFLEKVGKTISYLIIGYVFFDGSNYAEVILGMLFFFSVIEYLEQTNKTINLKEERLDARLKRIESMLGMLDYNDLKRLNELKEKDSLTLKQIERLVEEKPLSYTVSFSISPNYTEIIKAFCEKFPEYHYEDILENRSNISFIQEYSGVLCTNFQEIKDLPAKYEFTIYCDERSNAELIFYKDGVKVDEYDLLKNNWFKSAVSIKSKKHKNGKHYLVMECSNGSDFEVYFETDSDLSQTKDEQDFPEYFPLKELVECLKNIHKNFNGEFINHCHQNAFKKFPKYLEESFSRNGISYEIDTYNLASLALSNPVEDFDTQETEVISDKRLDIELYEHEQYWHNFKTKFFDFGIRVHFNE